MNTLIWDVPVHVLSNRNPLTPAWQWCTAPGIPHKHHKSLLIPAGYFKPFKPSSCLHELIPSNSSICAHPVCTPLPPRPAQPSPARPGPAQPSPTGAGAEQRGLGAVVQLHGAVVGAAVHGAVEGPALVDGGDVQVRGHGRAQLLPQLAVLARVRAPQACRQAQGCPCGPSSAEPHRCQDGTVPPPAKKRCCLNLTSHKDLSIAFFPLLNGPHWKAHWQRSISLTKSFDDTLTTWNFET